MSISAMKQALEALELIDKDIEWHDKSPTRKFCNQAAHFLRQAIEQAEKQEPAFYVIPATDRFGDGYEQTYWEDPAGFPVYTRPVHASDMSQERVDEMAKDRHDFECPRCGHCCRVDWVGLTDDEIDKFMPYCHTDQDLSDFRTFAFEIEAKLKEKNT